AAGVLAQWLREHCIGGRTYALFGALSDKDVAGIVAPLRSCVDRWLFCGLDRHSPRGLDAARLRARLGDAVPGHGTPDGPEGALGRAFAMSGAADRIVAFGSFFVVASVLEALRPVELAFSARA